MSSILHRIHVWSQEEPQSVAQRYKTKGKWKDITAKEFASRLTALASFLKNLGLKKQDAVAIFSYNKPEWVQADLAPHLLGVKTAGIYPNSTQKEAIYIIENIEAKVLFVQNEEYFKKLIADGQALPKSIESIVVFEGKVDFHSQAISFEEALKIGKSHQETHSMGEFLRDFDPNEGLFLIYTSGTTGLPKGALLSHQNLCFTADMVIQNWNLPRHGSMFSFLPLCHVAEKLQNVGAGISNRCVVHYCSAFDKLGEELKEVQPSILLCVPRLWEKMVEGVQIKVRQAPKTKRILAEWAFSVAHRVADAKFSGKSPSLFDLAQEQIAWKLVLSKIKDALGLSQIEISGSGAAPLAPNIAKFFRTLRMDIVEAYGQTESTGIICCTIPGKDCTGTVGYPAPLIEFKIADDGEILLRGPNVFKGYFKNPEATQKTFIEDWLATGDLGEWTENGMVKILGRKKEIMKTSGGKMIAPLPIEEKIKESDLISQACIVGDNRKYLSAILTLSEAELQILQKKKGALHADEVVDPEVLDRVSKVIEKINNDLAGFSKIKRFKVLSREFSVEQGEMTPTLKIKRAIVENKFSTLIDEMYR